MANTHKVLNEIMKGVKADPIYTALPVMDDINIRDLVADTIKDMTYTVSSQRFMYCEHEFNFHGVFKFQQSHRHINDYRVNNVIIVPGEIIKNTLKNPNYNPKSFINKRLKQVLQPLSCPVSCDEYFMTVLFWHFIQISPHTTNDDTIMTCEKEMRTMYTYVVLYLKYATKIAMKYACIDGICRVPLKDAVDLVVRYDRINCKYSAEFVPNKGFRTAIKTGFYEAIQGEKIMDEMRYSMP